MFASASRSRPMRSRQQLHRTTRLTPLSSAGFQPVSSQNAQGTATRLENANDAVLMGGHVNLRESPFYRFTSVLRPGSSARVNSAGSEAWPTAAISPWLAIRSAGHVRETNAGDR